MEYATLDIEMVSFVRLESWFPFFHGRQCLFRINSAHTEYLALWGGGLGIGLNLTGPLRHDFTTRLIGPA